MTPRPTRRSVAVAFLAAVSLLAPSGVSARVMDLSVADQWHLFDNVPAFDRTFDERGAEPRVVGVLYRSQFRPSALARSELDDLYEENAVTLGGRETRLVAIELTTTGELEGALIEEAVDLLYIPPRRGGVIADIARLSDEHRVATLTGVRDYVDLGVAVGIGLRGDRLEVLVNRDASRAQGMDLGSQLLAVTSVLTTPE